MEKSYGGCAPRMPKSLVNPVGSKVLGQLGVWHHGAPGEAPRQRSGSPTCAPRPPNEEGCMAAVVQTGLYQLTGTPNR